jgi:predicted ATPase with chaperone activity
VLELSVRFLSHDGVAGFACKALEVMREPLEEGSITMG